MDAHKFSIMRTITHELRNSSKWIFFYFQKGPNNILLSQQQFWFDNGFTELLLLQGTGLVGYCQAMFVI